MAIQTVGIVGAGTMGNGIAQACAVVGLDVVMVDISDAAVQKGIATVAGSLDRLIKKEKATEADKAAALARIQGSTSYDDLKRAADEAFEFAGRRGLRGDLFPGVLVKLATEIPLERLAAATGVDLNALAIALFAATMLGSVIAWKRRHRDG